jgi:hypothetical protein
VADVNGQEILQYWMSRYGRLSAASRLRFLGRQEVARLAKYPDDIVRQAIGWSNLLADTLSFAHSAYEGTPKPLPPEPEVSSAAHAANPPVWSRRRWNPELDRELAKRIGPVQSYEDTF